MRLGVLVVSVSIILSSALSRADADSRVVVVCGGAACATAVADLPARFELVVRGLDATSPAPHLRSAGKDRALTRCNDDKKAYCARVTAGELTALWIDGKAFPIMLPASVLDSLATKKNWNGSTTFKFVGDLGDLGDLSLLNRNEATSLNADGTRPIPKLETTDPPRVEVTPPKTNRPPPSEKKPADDGRTNLIPSEEPLPGLKPIPKDSSASEGAKRTYVPLPLDDDAYPDVVALGTATALDCSGVAIDRRWVLTARHCGKATRVVIATDVARPALTLSTDAVVLPSDPSVDLELLHTSSDLPITPHVRRHAGDAEPPSTDVRVLGYGISDFRSYAGFGIKRAFETAVDGWGCDGSRPRTTGCDPKRELVLPAVAGHDTCNGDSGGPVLELDAENQQWRLIGITSRAASVLQTGCGMGGIYVRVDAAATWIDQTVEGTR